MLISNALLTVVVPAYNVEKYLGRCLDSLVNQSVTAHRIIVVDDGATDSTPLLAESYAEKYPGFVSCIHQPNKGPGAARNTGLALADTEYVAFLDSDDWWDCLFVEKLLYELSQHDERPDLIFSLPWIYNMVTNTLEPWRDGGLIEAIFYGNVHKDDWVVSREVNVRNDRRLYELETNACRRIYRRQFLLDEGFAFPEGVKWEDVQPHFRLLHKAERCIGLRSTGFVYRINSGSQITGGTGASRMDVIRVFTDTLQMAYDANWSGEEIAYIIRMLWNFSAWSIGLTNTEYIAPLLRGLHKLFRSIPRKYYVIYFSLCTPWSRREKLPTLIIRSPFYKILADYRNRQMGKGLAHSLEGFMRKIRRH